MAKIKYLPETKAAICRVFLCWPEEHIFLSIRGLGNFNHGKLSA